MSFVLGIYDLTAWLLPGFMYIFLINEFLKLLNLRYITGSDFQSGFAWIGLAIIAFILGFLSLVILDQFWFFKHWPRSEEGLMRVKQRHPELKIDFKQSDWTLLYGILKERIGSSPSLEHAERFNAFSMMSRNLFGVFSLGIILQILKLIILGFDFFQLLLALLMLLLAVVVYKSFVWYWIRCMERLFCHFIAYGNNMETYLANDQPKWNFRENEPEK